MAPLNAGDFQRLLRVLALAALVPGVAHADATSEITVTVTDTASRPVGDAVVVAVPNEPSAGATARPRAESLDQIDKEFVPRVKPVFVGSTVTFPNHDNVRHHVYSFSPAKRFELPLYAGVPAQSVLFDKAGVVVLGCNIHDWMIGYIYVSESPYYATTGADGEVTISGIPAGDYTVRVWHPQLADVVEDTRRKLEANESADMLWRVALKPEVRIRRAPSATRRGPY